MRRTKKGLNFHFLLALAIFITVMSILITTQAEKLVVSDRPLGSAQFAILQAEDEAQKALTYLDEAARQSSIEAAERFRARGGLQKDYEGGAYPCDTYLDTPLWSVPEKNCIPDFEDNLKTAFRAILFLKLNAQDTYHYPSFALETATIPGATKLTARGSSPATIRFTGGGDQMMSLAGDAFTPDHYAAQRGAPLNLGGRGGNDVDFVVVHYTASGTLEGAVRTLQDAGFSYHYIIDHDGTVQQHVPEDKAAYHAGCKRDDENCKRPGSNQPSIGISFVNCGYKKECEGRNPSCANVDDEQCWEPYTEEQIESFVKLVADLTRRHENLLDDQEVLSEEALVMHSDITDDKTDPGPAFERKLKDYRSRINTAIKNQPEKIPYTEAQEASPGRTNAPAKDYTSSVTPKVEERLEDYDDSIKEHAARQGLEPAILKAFIAHESRGIADAESPTGALGLMQIIPSYHHESRCVPECDFSKDLDKEDYFDPDKNICCGASLVAELATKKPISWECCGQNFDQDICVKETYTQPYEIAARRYNTGKCEPWADPDFVEDVMTLYEFFGGNAAQFNKEGEGTYPGTYSFQAHFEKPIPIDLERFQSFERFAKEAQACTDDTKACLGQALAEHNRTTKDGYNLTEDCFQPTHAQTILGQLSGCLQAQPDTTCELEAPAEAPTTNYEIVINSTGVWVETDTPANFLQRLWPWSPQPSGPMLMLPGEEMDRYLKDPERPARANISLRFKEGSEEVDITIRAADGKERLKNQDLHEDEPLVFTRLKQGLAYGRREGETGWKPYVSSHSFCTLEENPTRFALTLRDQIPPPVESLSSTYLPKISAYFISWEAATRYDDGDDVPDIESYRVYCSTSGLPASGPLPQEALTHTITRSDGQPFTTSSFSGYEFRIPLLNCGEEPVGRGSVSVAVVPVDGAGQYNHTYNRYTLTPQLSTMTAPALIQPLDHLHGLEIDPDPFKAQAILDYNKLT